MLAYLFVAIAVAFRFMPHPFSFTPVAAALLFFGARMPRRQAWIPIALLAGSDVLLTKFVYGYALTPDHFVTWAWYAAAIAIGSLVAHKATVLRVTGASLASSVSFFLVSNLAVWMVWDMYPKTLNGLFLCYAAAVPFFRNTVASDLVFTAVAFSVPAVIEVLSPKTAKDSIAA